MAVGRITGPMLADNLIRNGVDLAFETNLLFLDVIDGRIGISTATPQYQLDVNGTAALQNLIVPQKSTLANFVITGSSITNTVGDVFISAGPEGKIRLQNSVEVTGNIHATGNITADGNVQIGNITGTDTVSVFANFTSDLIPQTPDNYNLGSADKTWANGYFNNVVADSILGFTGQEINIGQKLDRTGSDINVGPIVNPTINLNGPVRIWGDNPLGTSPTVSNILYVSMDGDDTNDGRAADASRACRTIGGAVKSPYYKYGTSIKVAPGHYYENNPIELKPYTSVIGSDLRTTSIEPINKTQDLFHVQSGNYLAQMQFLNGQSGLLPGPGYTPGTNRGAYCAAFPPNYGGTKIDVFHSPYIQNCTNQSGPWLMDGTMFFPNSTVQLPSAVGTGTWAINTTSITVSVSEGTIQVGHSVNVGPTPQDYVNARTLLLANLPFFQEQVIAYVDENNTLFGYNKENCIRDTGLIIDSMVADLVFGGNGYTQSNFAGLQYWSQQGYTGQIGNELSTTTNALSYVQILAEKLVANNTSGPRYQSTLTQTLGVASTQSAATIASEFTTIINILNSGTVGVTDQIVSNGITVVSADAQNAFNTLQANKAYIQAEAVAYVNAANPGFVYDQTKCYRDIGYIIDSVSFDILYGGNRQAIQSAVLYYGYSDTDSIVASEAPQVTAAYYRIKDIVSQIVINQVITKSEGNLSSQNTSLPSATSSEAQTLQSMVNLITEIINAGPNSALTLKPISVTKSANTNILNAAAILRANRAFIITEVISYVDQFYNNKFAYNEPKCYRDTGLIVDSIAMDILYAGDSQTTFAGLQYWNQDLGYTGAIGAEITTTTNAIQYLKQLAQSIIVNATGTTYQNTVTQILSSAATVAEQVTVGKEFDYIINILNTGTAGVTDSIVPNGIATTSTNILNAYSLLQANKPFMQAEIVAWVAANNPGFDYNHATCYRDVGYIIDSISFDLVHGGNRQAFQAGVYYYSYDANSTAVPNEVPQVVAAYDHIKNIIGKILTGQTVNPTTGNTSTQVTALSTASSGVVTTAYGLIDNITNIINNGPSVAGSKTPISLTPSVDPNTAYAYNMLMANRAFIQAETIAYTNLFNQGFVYNRAKCKRDIGLVVENIAYDVAFGGNAKTVEAGLAYWNGVTSYIPNEITTTTNAFTYLGELAVDVLANVTATNLLNTYQTAPQVINYVLTNGSTAAPLVTKLIGVMNNIIQNGPSVAPPVQTGNGPDWGSVSAEVLLQANRRFIQTEVINWVDDNFPNFIYREDLCYRDTGLIIDAISQDIILNANAKSIEAGLTYWTGGVNSVAKELTTTTAALNYAKSLALQIINNTTVTTSAFTFTSAKCARDTGLIVDALAQDLLFGGNSQSTFAGIQYWNHGNYVGNIPNEITTTTAALNYISSVAQKIVLNDFSGPRYQNTVTQVATVPATNAQKSTVANEFSVITNILTNGVTGITDTIIPNGFTANTDYNVVNAFTALQNNKSYLQAEVIAWIEANKSFKYNQAKCSRDTGLIVDSIIFDLLYPSTHGSSQATFAALSYWNQDSGYIGSIGNELTTTTNAINYVSNLAQAVVQNITAGTRYQNAVPQVTGTAATTAEATILQTEFNLITHIINSGTSGVTDLIVPNGISASTSTNINSAYTLLQANRAYIQAEAVAFVEATKTAGFVYNPDTCYRDVGYMIDSVSFDLLHGGNRQAIQSGVYYYTFDSTSTSIAGEIPQTIAAYQYLDTLVKSIAQNIVITPQQTDVAQVTTDLISANGSVINSIGAETDRIIKILENGPSEVAYKEPIGLSETSDGNLIIAATNILANKAFIQAEVIAYINKFFAFNYNVETCQRDIGYIIDSVSFDLLYGGNRQAIQSGVYYWGYNNTSTSLPREQNASTQAYNYMSQIISSIVTATPLPLTYQTAVTQVTNLPAATSNEAASIATNVELITTIINNGPASAPAKKPIGLVQSNNAFVNNAVALLEANRSFIQAEVIAFVDATIVSNQQVINTFYNKGANATLSVTRNFDLITNIVNNGPGVAPTSTQGNGIYNYTGLVGDDVRIAPTVTSVTTVTTGTYLVTLSQSTVGYGDSTTLYFGDTLVFPLLDSAIPDRWQQRRINPYGSMGGALVDGAVVSARSPINSFVFDAFTQVNQGGIGIHINNNGYAQLVSVFTIFCSTAVLTENGGIASITNSNANFGDQCLVSKGYGTREFSGYIYNPPVAPYYPNGVYPQSGSVEVYIADPGLRPHISLIMEVEPPEGYKNYQGLPGFLTGNTNIGVLTTGTILITGIDNTGMVVGQSFYVVDQYGLQVDANNQPYVTPGTIVADVAYQSVTLNYPLNSGGGDPNNSNYFNLYTSGNAYYTVLSSTVAPDPITPGTLLLPGVQNLQEDVALGFLGTLTSYIISNTPVTPLQTATTQVYDLSLVGGAGAESFIVNDLNIIGSILVNGYSSAPTVTTSGTLPTGASQAASLLNDNRAFIQDEVVQYINNTYPPFTYNQQTCYRDTGLIVDAIAQDLLFLTDSQSTFAGIQYWNQVSYTGAIGSEITTTTAAISYIKTLSQQVIQNITGGTRYGTETQITGIAGTIDESNTIGADFDLILSILNTGTAGVTDLIVPNGITTSTNANVVNSYNLLQANRQYIQSEAVAFVESTKTPGFAYNTATCYRDVGYIIDSVSFDLLYGGNRQAIQSAVYYYGYSTTSSSVSNELPEVTAAYQHLSIIADQIIRGETVTTYQSTVTQIAYLPKGTSAESTIVADRLNLITNIINNGPYVVNGPLPVTTCTDINAVNSAMMIEQNRNFIIAETNAYINSAFPGFVYNTATCSRDTGLIVDAIAQDLAFNSFSQIYFAGEQYWNHNGYVGAIASELTTTTAAINYVKNLAQKIVLNDTSGPRYQSIATQSTSLSPATSAEASAIGADFNVILQILNTGTSGVTDLIVPNSLTPSGSFNVNVAFENLQANKAYIQAEAVAYVDAIKSSGFNYNSETCYRDVGYMIDAISIDLLYGGNRQAVQAGTYYYGFNASSTALPGEQIQAVAAYNYIKSILPNIVEGVPLPSTYQGTVSQVTSGTPGNVEWAEVAQINVDILTGIITNGPKAPLPKRPINLNMSSTQSVINAAAILKANRTFMQAETIAYINKAFGSYNVAKCKRDVGLIVDALVYDLANGGNYNAVVAGQSYYATHGTHHIVNLEEAVTDPGLFPDGAIINFYQRSYQSASGYLFEYVGAGTNYGALPQRGKADVVQTKETIQLNNGKVFFTSTDQNGDFRIGPGLVISQATGVLSGRTFTKSLFANMTPFILAIE